MKVNWEMMRELGPFVAALVITLAMFVALLFFPDELLTLAGHLHP